ncbi:MAG: glycosyltransferase [Candidatus Hydrogenedentes bacterium]|nr:glycosyltransferase [Candidatus Hydrogenedentota bacterium]
MLTDNEMADGPHVLLLGSFPPQAQGIPGYCGALAEALAQHGPVDAIGFKAMYPRWLFPGVKDVMDPTGTVPEAPGLTVRHVLTWYNPLGWCWYAFRARVDVVHIQWWSLPLAPVCITFALLARLRGVPVVLTAHNVLPHEPSPWFLRSSHLLYGLASHIFVHSEMNREQLLAEFGVDASRVSHVPMGILGAGRPTMDTKEARRVLDLPLNRPTLLFFGIIRPYKGLDVLLHALALVRDTHPEVQLLIAGKPWGTWELYQAIIEAKGLAECVHLRLDYIPEAEVGHYFAAADLVVLPYTHFDAQSAVGVQVLGYGKPLLVTKTGGLPDLVGGDPRWCVEAQNVEALSDAIGTFFNDPVEANAQFASLRQGRHEVLSWSASARTHATIYTWLLEKEARPT